MMTGVRVLPDLSGGRSICQQFVWRALITAFSALLACLATLAASLPAFGGTTASCTPVAPTPEPARRINLVLDESGSMFFEPSGKAIDRWSFAKYSLEVFAALMGPNDELNVYRMSDYVDGSQQTGPTMTLVGSAPVAERVAQVHEMPMIGTGTPYKSVQSASANLVAQSDPGDARQDWLVVLTDGEFFDNQAQVPAKQVEADLKPLCAKGVSVAFMAIGSDAPEITGADCLEFVRATTSTDLIKEMTGFSNRIFNRSVASADTLTWSPDIPLSEVKVFAQGPGVAIGGATTSAGPVQPTSVVPVSWTENPPVETSTGKKIEAKPNTSLEGVVATFENVPAGQATLDIQNAQEVNVFYKPDLSFGAVMSDSSGNPVDGQAIFAGQEYTLDYGLMDADCRIVHSKMLGDVKYGGSLLQDGKKVQADISPGDVITLPEGNVVLHVTAQGPGVATQVDIPLTSGSPVPSAPLDVVATPGNSSATVTWTAPEYDGGAPISKYTVTSDSGENCSTETELACTVTGLENGHAYTFTVTATNETGNESPPSEPAQVAPFASAIPDYIVSRMAQFPGPAGGMHFLYVITENGVKRPPSAAEWNELDVATIATESDANLEYQIIKGDQPGELTLLPRAPGGDVYAASTGDISVTLSLPQVEGRTNSPATVSFVVVDDLSSAERGKHWFFTTGLRLLFLLALIVLILGYVLKKRFPKRIKKSPNVNGHPKVIGQGSLQARGKFQVNGLRKLLPFVADRATYTYVPPGVMGFPQMQLKAGKQKMVRLTNWRQVAKQGNVQINGNPLDESTTREPMFHASAMITADTPQMSYESSMTQ